MPWSPIRPRNSRSSKVSPANTTDGLTAVTSTNGWSIVPPMVASVVRAPDRRHASGTASCSSRASAVVAWAVPASVRASRSIVTSPAASVVSWRMVNGATTTR